MPRFGNRYKMYDLILPNLELDVTHIVENGACYRVLSSSLSVSPFDDLKSCTRVAAKKKGGGGGRTPCVKVCNDFNACF